MNDYDDTEEVTDLPIWLVYYGVFPVLLLGSICGGLWLGRMLV